MTPDQHDLDENASRAHDFLHALITPLIPHDPTGIGIKVNGENVILLSSARNMGALIGKGGIVRDEAAQQAACDAIAANLAELGWTVAHRLDSPVTGGDGNREFLLVAERR